MAGGCDRKKVSSSPLRRFSTHYSEMDGGLLENQMIKLYVLECFKPTTVYSRMASNLRQIYKFEVSSCSISRMRPILLIESVKLEKK